MNPYRRTASLVFAGCLASLPLVGCSNGFWFFSGSPEGIIRPSIKPFQPPVYAPISNVTPVPYVPDPPLIQVNPVTGAVTNKATGVVLRGTVAPLPGEPAPPSSDPRTVATTVDGLRVNFIDLGNTLLVETSGLTPGAAYVANMTWPDGRVTKREFTGNTAGNIETPFGEPYLEYPHSGFFRMQVKSQEPSVIAGQYKVELTRAGQPPEQTLFYTVRARPVIFITDEKYVDAVHFFTDKPAKVFIHGEGFKANQTVHVWVLKHTIGHLTPLQDGITLKDKVFDKLENLTFTANAKGVFHKPLMSWAARENPEDEAPMVVVGKVLNNLPTYKAAEDIAIIDHPAMTLVSSKRLEEMLKPYPNVPATAL